MKVKNWRQLYSVGVADADGGNQKLSLEDAAKKVGISKKSLDDYFLQLKNGKKNGFNFNEHKNDKIGILRAWNKKHKKEEGTSGPGRKRKGE